MQANAPHRPSQALAAGNEYAARLLHTHFKGSISNLFKVVPQVYKDDNHKPEMAIALTDFEALCGFVEHGELVSALQSVPELRSVVGEVPLHLSTFSVCRASTSSAAISAKSFPLGFRVSAEIHISSYILSRGLLSSSIAMMSYIPGALPI